MEIEISRYLLHPGTWPWFVWGWIFMVLIGCVKPLSKRIQTKRAAHWNTAQAKIQATNVTRKLLGEQQRPFVSEVTYSYSVEGAPYSGHYQRHFSSKDEAEDFLRGLQEKSVLIRHYPANPATSILLEPDVNRMLDGRPAFHSTITPLPALPGWLGPFMVPLAALSTIGFVLGLWINIGALFGKQVAPSSFFWLLHLGVFVVWSPVAFIARRLGRRSDLLKHSSVWMRSLVRLSGGYAFLNLLLVIVTTPHIPPTHGVPLAAWRVFSGLWMLFYSAALAVFTTHIASAQKAAASSASGLMTPQ